MRASKYFVLLALVGCGPSDRNSGGGDDTNPGIDSGIIDPGNNGCTDAAKLVYVVDQANLLYTFEPMSKSFTLVGGTGRLDACNSAGASPFSMGIDRNAQAWILYTDSSIYNVDTSTLACTKTSFQSSALKEFGMGFSTDAAGGTVDTLFISGGTDPSATQSQLAKLDTTSMMPTNIAKIPGQPELTGNSNGELWGFFPSNNTGTTTPRVEQINKTTGVAIKTFMLTNPALSGVPAAWAFAFWGGDYWVFLETEFETSTTVYQVDGMTGAIKSMTDTGGKTIVGAGVSTCAPIVIL